MQSIKSAAHVVFERAGGTRLMRYVNRKYLRILLYHRFPSSLPGVVDSLTRQCAHLRRNYHLVSLTEVAHSLRSGIPLPANSLAVTVDDGYRDCFSVAYPIFAAYQVPFTIFLTTCFLDRKEWLWVDRVKYAFEHAHTEAVEIELGPGQAAQFNLGSRKERTRAAYIVKEAAKRMLKSERLKLVEELPRLLKTSLPGEPPEEYSPLKWDEVRTMERHGVDFGAHTKTHPILSRVGDEKELREEIQGSKLRIEAELGRPVLCFSYPNGLWEDFNLQVIEEVKRAAFEIALIAEEGLNLPTTDPFLLWRIGVAPDLPQRAFQRCAAGFP